MSLGASTRIRSHSARDTNAARPVRLFVTNLKTAAPWPGVESARAHVALDAARLAIQSLAQIEGHRRILIYVSNGYIDFDQVRFRRDRPELTMTLLGQTSSSPHLIHATSPALQRVTPSLTKSHLVEPRRHREWHGRICCWIWIFPKIGT